MRILIICEYSKYDKIYQMIEQTIKIDMTVTVYDIKKELSEIEDIQYDFIIIDFDRQQIEEGNFKIIFDIRCKTQVPIIVILDACKTRDKLQVLNMKADDYIERPLDVKEFKQKVLQLLNIIS